MIIARVNDPSTTPSSTTPTKSTNRETRSGATGNRHSMHTTPMHICANIWTGITSGPPPERRATPPRPPRERPRMIPFGRQPAGWQTREEVCRRFGVSRFPSSAGTGPAERGGSASDMPDGTNSAGSPRLVKAADVAAMLAMSKSWVTAVARDGRLPAVYMPNASGRPASVRFDEISRSVERWRAAWRPGDSTLRTARRAAEEGTTVAGDSSASGAQTAG
jgi:hypothetical protein